MACHPFEAALSIRIACGPGRIEQLAADLDRLAAPGRPVLLAADQGVLAAGLVARVEAVLAAAGRPVVRFAELSGEPKAAAIDAAAAQARAADAAAVVALGGGSALDLGKLAAAIAVADAPAEAYALMATPLPARPLPVIAVPTTAGTGSEVTRTSVFTDRAGHKVWAWGDGLRPALALLDPTMTHGLPPALTAMTGADALVHAIEAATSRRCQPLAAAHGLEAIRLLRRHLAPAVADGADLEARGGVLVAACLAGLAIDAAGTGIAHALGHALGSLAPVPHGRAVALALRAALAWNVAGAPAAYAGVAEALGVAAPSAALPAALAGHFAEWLDRIGVVAGLADHGLGPAAAPDLVERTLAQENQPMLAANARAATRADLDALAAAILAA
jgi:alcohol dehydrogenase class IV